MHSPAAAPPRRRRSQGERRATTRKALLDATVSSLVERGYAKTTTTEVAHRAGLSLGALSDHFPAKTDLLTAALEHVLLQRVMEFDRIIAEQDDVHLDWPRTVDIVWELVQSSAFVAWLELWIAARSDPELHRSMVEVDARFTEAVAERWSEALVAGPERDHPQAIRSLLFAACYGLALRRITSVAHEADAEDVLDLLKSIRPDGEVA